MDSLAHSEQLTRASSQDGTRGGSRCDGTRPEGQEPQEAGGLGVASWCPCFALSARLLYREH